MRSYPHHRPPAKSSACLLISCIFSLPVLAQDAQDEKPLEITGSIEAGLEHNNNLSIPELESSSGSSDIALVVDGDIDLAWTPAQNWKLESGYSYSGSRYQDLDAYDIDLHLLHADLSREINDLTLGGNIYHAAAELGGNDFLTLKQYSLYAGQLFSEKYYLRGSLNLTDKSFDALETRDADSQGFSLDGFWFFNQGQSSLMLGFTAADEDAQADQYDYDSDGFRVRFSHRFPLTGINTRLQLGYRWEQRDYSDITPAINEPRDDKRAMLEAQWNLSLTERVDVIGKVERGDYRSNLESADYDETRITVSAAYEF